MKEKVIVNVVLPEEILFYQKNGINNFLVPLDKFCVGYQTMSADLIKNLRGNLYLLINRILDKEGIESLKEILPAIDNIKGIFFDDLGVLEIINELKLKVEKIYFPNHFATNYASINAYFKRGIDSVVLSNEITKEEVEQILDKVQNEVVVQILGYNQIMYSRRKLISNFVNEYNEDIARDTKIKEQSSQKVLKIKENEYGTVIFDEYIYNNLELMDYSKNIKFYYINATDIDAKLVVQALDKIIALPNTKNGFLEQKTVFKVGDLK